MKKKYYLYTKYIKKVLKVKNTNSLLKIEEMKKEMRNNNNNRHYPIIDIKEYTPKINTKNENPVVTLEKERERALHQTILFGKIFKFSINNYYDLNLYLNDLTFHQLYYQPFMDSSLIKKQAIDDKRIFILVYLKDKVIIKEELKLFNSILTKIEKNENLLDSIGVEPLETKKDNFLLHKLLDYIIIYKKDNFYFKKLLMIFNIDENQKKKMEIKGKMNMKKFLIETKNDLQLAKKFNKFDLLNKSTITILNKDKLDEIKQKYNFVEKKKIENTDNQILFNTVKKYNEGKSIFIKEFSDTYVPVDNKDD
jgi:hypothetical protein